MTPRFRCRARAILWALSTALNLTPKFTLVAALVFLAPGHVIARQSADLGHTLEGSVLVYNVFVEPDDGVEEWTDGTMNAVLETVRDAADQIQSMALETNAQLGVSIELAVAPGPSRKISGEAGGYLYQGLKQPWICEALSFLDPIIGRNQDGDGACSDDAALYFQSLYSVDHVVLAFHVWVAEDLCNSMTGTVGGVDREVQGPIVAYYGIDSSWERYAHEMLHQFGACDEYGTSGACCVCDNAYVLYGYGALAPNGETNPNCQGCFYNNSLACLMKSCAPEGSICPHSQRQIGWDDWNNNGSPDAIDFTDGLETRSLTSTAAFRLWGPAGQFLVTDAAGGELKTAPRAESLGVYTFADTLPLPFIDATRLVADSNHLFAMGMHYGSYPNYWYADSIYSCAYQGNAITDGWKVAGAAPNAGVEAATACNGFLYVSGSGGEGGPGIRYSRIKDDGTLEAWIPVPAPPVPYSWDRVASMVAANGFLYATWSYWLGQYQGFQVFVSGAPIRPDGSIGPWDAPNLVTQTSFPYYLQISDIVSDGTGLFLAAMADNAARVWSTQLASDGTRVAWSQGPTLPVLHGPHRPIVTAGRFFLLGGNSWPVNEVWMTQIQADKTLGPWQRVSNLPFQIGATLPGACMTSDDDSIFVWVGGGMANSGAQTTHNDLYVAPLVFSSEYAPEARASYLLNLGGQKNLRSIAWRSTKPENVLLRYRHATDLGGAFATWEDPASEQNGRIVFPGQGLPSVALEIELIATGDTRIHDVTVVYSDPNPGSTPTGFDVLATLPSSAGQCLFESVTQAGMTTADATQTPPTPPPGFAARSTFDVSTSASVDGPFEIGIRYDPLTVGSEAELRLFHWNGTGWDDVTTSVDPIGRMVRGQTVGFSTFAVMEDTSRSELVGVALPGASHPPLELNVEENAPNPFTQSTRIRFGLSSPSRAILRVYEASGRVVRTLLDEPRPGGPNEVTWDGIDGEGNRVPSGVYFFQLQAGTRSETKKAVLVR